MIWTASLTADYRWRGDRTVAHFVHSGPLRILQSLCPEGEAVCHDVIVHPPGGLAVGDTLSLQFHVASGAHGLVTTPGATRFYRADGRPARQHSQLQVGADARLVRLPLETIAYRGDWAENRLSMDVHAGGEMIGWDVTALGLPAADAPFKSQGHAADSGTNQGGEFTRHIEVPGIWLERARIRADDIRLLNSPLGLASHHCLASLFLVTGTPLARVRRQLALNSARDVITNHPLRATAGATSPNGCVVVARVLAPMVEPALGLLKQICKAWRAELWKLPGVNRHIWSV